MKRFIPTIFAALAILAPVLPASATTHDTAQAHAGHHAALTDGEVRKVDKQANKLTLRHGAITNLDMPPMTMVFQVRDPAMLDRVKTGDKVRFSADKVDGAYTVTAMEQVK